MKKENNVILSIIIPNYNKGKLLKNCIDSIIFQDLSNVEVLVIDDCSTDDSYELLKSYTNIKIIKNESNMGVSLTRNKGLDLSSGKYVTFIDSDDLVSPDYIKELKKVLKEDADIYIYDVTRLKTGKNPKEYESRLKGLVDMKEYMTTNSDEFLKANISYWVWNKVFKKSIIEKCRLKFKNIYGEDEDFCSNYMLNIDNLFFINKKLYYYIINETSLSESKSILYATPFTTVTNNNYAIFDKYNGNFECLLKDVMTMFEVGYANSNDIKDRALLEKQKKIVISKINNR